MRTAGWSPEGSSPPQDAYISPRVRAGNYKRMRGTWAELVLEGAS
jgi:hypothetical protein